VDVEVTRGDEPSDGFVLLQSSIQNGMLFCGARNRTLWVTLLEPRDRSHRMSCGLPCNTACDLPDTTTCDLPRKTSCIRTSRQQVIHCARPEANRITWQNRPVSPLQGSARRSSWRDFWGWIACADRHPVSADQLQLGSPDFCTRMGDSRGGGACNQRCLAV